MGKTQLDRLMRLDEVLEVCALKRNQVYRWISEGRFPAPIKPGGPGTQASRWRESTIAEWLDQDPEARSAKGPTE